jgi:hypothetical protein
VSSQYGREGGRGAGAERGAEHWAGVGTVGEASWACVRIACRVPRPLLTHAARARGGSGCAQPDASVRRSEHECSPNASRGCSPKMHSTPTRNRRPLRLRTVQAVRAQLAAASTVLRGPGGVAARAAEGATPPPPLPPVLTGHASSLLPY